MRRAAVVSEARRAAEREGIPRRTRWRMLARRAVRAKQAGRAAERLAPWTRFDEARPPRFLCDPSLAGLARWLRAAGYEARLAPGVPGTGSRTRRCGAGSSC